MRVVVAQEQPGSSEAIRQLLLGMGLECAAGDCVAHEGLSVRLAQNPTDLVLVRAGAEPGMTISAVRQALPLTRAPIMVMGATKDAGQILQYLQAGAREFLDETRLQESLENALEKLRQSGESRKGQGNVIGVVSATPGGGVTTVAINLAFTHAAAYPNEVALLEMGQALPIWPWRSTSNRDTPSQTCIRNTTVWMHACSNRACWNIPAAFRF